MQYKTQQCALCFVVSTNLPRTPSNAILWLAKLLAIYSLLKISEWLSNVRFSKTSYCFESACEENLDKVSMTSRFILKQLDDLLSIWLPWEKSRTHNIIVIKMVQKYCFYFFDYAKGTYLLLFTHFHPMMVSCAHLKTNVTLFRCLYSSSSSNWKEFSGQVLFVSFEVELDLANRFTGFFRISTFCCPKLFLCIIST